MSYLYSTVIFFYRGSMLCLEHFLEFIKMLKERHAANIAFMLNM